MINKEQLKAKYKLEDEELLNDVEFHVEGLKFDFAEEVSKYLGKGERKITRAELARKMNSKPAWITKMLRTNWNMTMETMAKIAFALGMKIELKFTPLKSQSLQCENMHLHARIFPERVQERLSNFPVPTFAREFSLSMDHNFEDFLKTQEEEKDETLALAS